MEKPVKGRALMGAGMAVAAPKPRAAKQPVILRSLRWVREIVKGGRVVGFVGRSSNKPPVNGARECARRRRQMGTGEYAPRP